jgi:hypothetical protein
MLQYAISIATCATLLGSLAGCGQPCGALGEMCRVAGTGERASGLDGLQARSTPLYWVSSVKRGPDGRIYLMDQNGYRLRAVQPNGTLITVAGIGEHSGAVIGEPADRTGFLDPLDFAFRADGRLVIVSWHDTRLLEVDLDGVVRLVAGNGTGDANDPTTACRGTGDGGPASAAGFCELAAIAIARDGRIFVADDLAHQIRVVMTDGTIDTYAGDGNQGFGGDGGAARAAHLDTPSALALDADDNLYVADTGNHVVRRIAADTQVIETVVGNNQSGFSGDGGPCTQASMSFPAGVAAATDGTLYISDTYNNRIRRVDLRADRIDTIAGNGQRALAGDDGPAAAAELYHPARLSITDGRLYIGDLLNNVARSVRVE